MVEGLTDLNDEELDRIARNRRRTSYPESRVIALAEEAAKLGILCHIDGFPFGAKK